MANKTTINIGHVENVNPNVKEVNSTIIVQPSDIEMIPITWEDVRKLCALSVHVEMDLGRYVSDKEHYSEVLRRFKEWKKTP